LDRFIKPEEGDGRIYDLMKEVFGALVSPPARGGVRGGGSNQTAPNPSPSAVSSGQSNCLSKEGDNKLQKIRVYFFWRLADLLGYRPQLDECVLCGSIIIGSSKFNITENIVICDKCRGEGIKINEIALENLRTVFRIPLREFITYNLDSQLFSITNNARQIKLSEL
jgi:hypothetical protein